MNNKLHIIIRHDRTHLPIDPEEGHNNTSENKKNKESKNNQMDKY